MSEGKSAMKFDAIRWAVRDVRSAVAAEVFRAGRNIVELRVGDGWLYKPVRVEGPMDSLERIARRLRLVDDD